jgi:hypothetical protein
VAMRLISSWSWKWSLSWRFWRCSASAFRSCVARHLCLQNFSRPYTKYMFFYWRCSRPSPVRVSNKIYTKAKRKLGFSKTLDWFFLCCGWSKSRDTKRKIKRKTENIHKRNTRLNLDYLFPGNSTRKWGLLIVKICIKFCLDSQAYKSTVIAKGPFFP